MSCAENYETVLFLQASFELFRVILVPCNWPIVEYNSIVRKAPGTGFRLEQKIASVLRISIRIVHKRVKFFSQAFNRNSTLYKVTDISWTWISNASIY